MPLAKQGNGVLPGKVPELTRREGINVFENIRNFLRESYVELRRVTWPSRKEIFGSTLVVFIVVGILMTFIALFDVLLAFLLRLIV